MGEKTPSNLGPRLDKFYCSQWGLRGLNSVPMIPPLDEPPPEPPKPAGEPERADSHLRSTQELTGYEIQALDGDVGHLEDFLIDDENWAIRSLAVATGNWWAGKNVLVPSKSISRVDWEEATLFVNLTRSAVHQEPEYTRAGSVDADHDPRVFRE
jgi:hypothetical protein